jgi:glucose-1-phosphate cytidylyltransferase
VRPAHSVHVVEADEGGLVRSVSDAREAGLWINGGFFIFKRSIFAAMRAGEELVEQPFRRLITEQQLFAYRYTGFWACMDTFKDKQRFDDMEARGDTPWQVWRDPSAHA